VVWPDGGRGVAGLRRWFIQGLKDERVSERAAPMLTLMALGAVLLSLPFLFGWQLTGNPSGWRAFRFLFVLAALHGLLATMAAVARFAKHRRRAS
jgi:hypothetical protein